MLRIFNQRIKHRIIKMKKQTILIPTDFSDNAFNAIVYAISMFNGEKPDYILLNSYRITPIPPGEYIPEMADFGSISKEGLVQVLQKIKNAFPQKDLNIEVVSKLGYPVETMHKIVDRKKVDMVVMGTKGASGLREILIGSNTADAIKNLSCPVLAIPENSRFSPLKNIALAADFKSLDKELLLDPMVDIAKKYKSEILIVHVELNGKTEKVEEVLQGIKLNEYFKNIPHIFREVEDSNPAEGIEKFIKTHTVDMLVSVARKHSFWENFFKGSTTRKLAMHTTVPLLALQSK